MCESGGVNVILCTNQRIKHTEDASLERHRNKAAVTDGGDNCRTEEYRLHNGPFLGHRRELILRVEQKAILCGLLDRLLVLPQLAGY